MHDVMKIHNLRKEFYNISGISVPMVDWYGRGGFLYGIDIVKLDERLKTPDGISMSDFIKEKYGKRAADIIEELCDSIYFIESKAKNERQYNILHQTITIGTLLKFFIFWTLTWWIISYIPLDSTDKDFFHRSDLKLHIDNMTGCHYLSTRKGHIIPRLDKDGKQVCSGYESEAKNVR